MTPKDEPYSGFTRLILRTSDLVDRSVGIRGKTTDEFFAAEEAFDKAMVWLEHQPLLVSFEKLEDTLLLLKKITNGQTQSDAKETLRAVRELKELERRLIDACFGDLITTLSFDLGRKETLLEVRRGLDLWLDYGGSLTEFFEKLEDTVSLIRLKVSEGVGDNLERYMNSFRNTLSYNHGPMPASLQERALEVVTSMEHELQELWAEVLLRHETKL